MARQVFWVSHGWILNGSILFHTVYHLPRVNRTSEKYGGNLSEDIQIKIQIR